MSSFSRFKNYLTQPVDGQVLGLFRVLYGLLMMYEMFDYIKIDLVKNMFVLPLVNFKYDGLEWLTPMPESYMDAIMYALLALAALMTIGIWFKWAARLFALGYAYIFLIDKSIYNNHIYLFILLALLLSCTHADQFLSLRKKSIGKILRWEQFIIQFQMVIVYFYAALVKMKPDWLLEQQPMRSGLMGISNDHWLAPLFKTEFFIYVVTYSGLMLDLCSPLLLWYKPFRRFGIVLLALFHLTNTQIFDDIGIFPIVMLCGLIIFFEWPELKWLQSRLPTTDTTSKSKNKKGDTTISIKALSEPQQPNKWLVNTLYAYFVIQLLFPLRGFFLPNDLDWTTIGNRFAWRVKADNKAPKELSFQIFDYYGRPSNVEINTFINTHQIKMMLSDPRCVRELALAIEKDIKKQGIPVSAVKARIQISNNGKPPQFFVDPNVDLTQVKYTPWRKNTWIMDLVHDNK
jgi:vitamin K-dependent gamma-carboxylase